MGPRRKGRVLAIQALYSYEIRGGVPLAELLRFPWNEEKEEDGGGATEFAALLVTGTLENLGEIDRIIQEHLENWELGRVSKVDLSILRMSVYCLLYQKDIPYTVVIDEAVILSKEFGTDDSYRFVNGVLDGIRKTLQHRERENP